MKANFVLLLTAAAITAGILLLPDESPCASRHVRVVTAVAPRTPYITDAAPSPPAAGFDHARLFRQLTTSSDPDVLVLTESILTADSAQAKGRAADRLAAIGSHESVSHLLMLAALQDDSTHRAAILEGLNNVTGPDGLATLASTLTATRDAEVLAAATATLARAGGAETLAALVEFYRERNDGPQQKNSVLRAIAALRNPSVKRPLAKLAQHAAEPGIAAAAREALLARTESSAP